MGGGGGGERMECIQSTFSTRHYSVLSLCVVFHVGRFEMFTFLFFPPVHSLFSLFFCPCSSADSCCFHGDGNHISNIGSDSHAGQ